MQAAPSGTQGNHTAGIVLMCVGVACLSANDAVAKALTAHYTPLQILFLRNVIALPFTVLIAFIMGGRPALKTHRPLAHLLRGVLWVAATMLFFTSFIYLGLAEATALIFVAPVFITVISALFLGERVHIRRWLAVFFGFLGVLIIIRPGGATFQAASQQVHADRHYFSGKHIRSVASVLIQCGKAPQLRLSLI
ncbi:DMT family transporter [Martelella mediterranea]|uniref:DMT family transporter n=1 Tax=Martelella mediterranea TaxID=293089 RepID=UPI001E54F208|nr:DMT family transporter [Martelella mediterranea]